MTTIYKRQRELVELANKYAHAINDGLIAEGEVTRAQSVVHGVIAGAAFAAMSMTASPPTLATDRYGRLPRSESVSIGCLTPELTRERSESR